MHIKKIRIAIIYVAHVFGNTCIVYTLFKTFIIYHHIIIAWFFGNTCILFTFVQDIENRSWYHIASYHHGEMWCSWLVYKCIICIILAFILCVNSRLYHTCKDLYNIYVYIYISILCKYILIMRERFHSCHAKSKPYTTICPCQTRHVHRSGITMCFDRAECAIRLPDDMEEEEEEEVLDDDQERVDGWTDMEEPTCKWVCYNINITCCELAVHGPPSACSVFWILAMIVSSHLALAIGSWQPLRAGKYSWWRCQLGHLESKGWWMTSWNPTPRKADRHS